MTKLSGVRNEKFRNKINSGAYDDWEYLNYKFFYFTHYYENDYVAKVESYIGWEQQAQKNYLIVLENTDSDN